MRRSRSNNLKGAKKAGRRRHYFIQSFNFVWIFRPFYCDPIELLKGPRVNINSWCILVRSSALYMYMYTTAVHVYRPSSKICIFCINQIMHSWGTESPLRDVWTVNCVHTKQRTTSLLAAAVCRCVSRPARSIHIATRNVDNVYV